MRPLGLSARLAPASPANFCWHSTRHLGLRCRSLSSTAANAAVKTSPAGRAVRRCFASSSLPRASAAVSSPSSPSSSSSLKAGFFNSNTNTASTPQAESTSYDTPPDTTTSSMSSISSISPTLSSSSSSTSASPTIAEANAHLPHRRRQAARRAAATTTTTTTTTSNDDDNNPSSVLPQNASDVLTTVAAAQPANSLRRNLSAFLSLTKPRLTVLVVLTATATYALYPVPAFLSAAAETPSLSPLTLLFLTTGTTLCSAAANTLNMLYEPATDALMSRTRNRPLVRALVTRRAALLFALACATLGTTLLHTGVNPTVAFLGAANIVLYAGLYTPLKRLSWLNTWVGALVGGIPPLMGWAAAAGESATGDGTFRELLFAADGSSLGGWLMAALLFAWQFPHFMALSWSIRDEYRAAGLRMLAWVNPARNARVALRYSLAFVPICVGLCAVGVTEWSFAVTSAPANAWLVREAWRFHRHQGLKGSARGLFWASVWHLPAVMVLALVQKKGMWQRVWRGIFGVPEEDGDEDDEWEEVEDEDEQHVGVVVAQSVGRK
ncbi:UbiA prenyltransferase family-domain-containing protein [Coniella lustricola]|uniref:Protoheme IX farnesyltransferase, mitochondrial n=1 Tax=Coniella lustricola TaxID=2025994 RepID=A0A2T2ZT17_9PEZI|nr:UbiA prenyltransferase family-domain-containing protein [Coniella lustricola]